jgi:hypothetical protein
LDPKKENTKETYTPQTWTQKKENTRETQKKKKMQAGNTF